MEKQPNEYITLLCPSNEKKMGDFLKTVSIIMPIYNKGAYLKDSIESVLRQSYPHFELILINDGSTDNSEEIIFKYLVSDSRLRYCKQENKGVAAARNTGISMATGEYIAFLDADDLYNELFLEKMLEVIKDKNVSICNYDFKSEGNLIKTKWTCKEGDILVDYINNKCIPNMNCWLLKRAFISTYKLSFPVNNSWGEDQSFFMKVLCHENDVSCVNEALSIYNTDIPGSLSGNSLNKLFEDIAWISEIKHYIEQHVIDPDRKVAAHYAIDTYKLPALLIYRLVLNKGLVEKQLYAESYNQVKQYINQFKFSNGLRSIKLFIAKLKL